MPSRVDRRRLGLGVAVGLAVVVITAGRASAGNGDSWVRVLAEDDTGIDLLLSAPEPERTPDGLRLPGFAAGGGPGEPEWYERAVTIGVPGPGGARLEVLSSLERDLGAAPRRILPAPVSVAERHAAFERGEVAPEWRDVPALRLESPVPARAVELGGGGRLRGRDVVTLHFRPVQFRPDGGATLTSEVRLRIRWADPVRRRPVPLDEPVHAALLNASSAARWEIAPQAPEAPRRQPAALPAVRLRIPTPIRGVYELGYSDLLSAGVPVGQPNFDPRTLRLYFDSWKPVALPADSVPASWQPSWEMQEAAVWVEGEENGSFDVGDRIVFYALGAAGYGDLAGTSTDSLAYFRHPYDRNAYAWLTWGGEFGLRMTTESVAVPGGSNAPITTRVGHREHHEQDVTYDAVDDLWYWEEIRAARAVTKSFSVDLGGEAASPGTLRVAFAYPGGGGRHVIEVLVNGTLVGTADFFLSASTARRFSFPVTLRGDRENTLQMRVGPGDTSRGTHFLEFDVTYERPLVAIAGRFLAWSARPDPLGPSVYDLAGFGNQAPLVFDVTDPLRPVRLLDPTPAGAGVATTWRVHRDVADRARQHSISVLGPVYLQPRDLALRSVAPLREATTSPDMLIVAHESLRAAAERLAAHRRSHYPGSASPDIRVVGTTDIYENFSGGRLDPLAIRNYAKFLYGLESPPRLRFMLLFGDGNHDMRQLSGGSPASLVPPFEPGYVDPSFNRQGNVYAVEDWFGEMETPRTVSPPFPLPDLGIGRLAARNLAEAERIVDKIIAYETTSGFGAWRARVLMVGDDECHPVGPNPCTETFHINNTEQLCARVPRDLDVVKFYLTEYPDQLGQKPLARAAFIRTWSEGCVLLNYQGHGAPRQLADEVLFLSTDIPSLTNGAKLPIFLPISCTVSEFDVPERQSMCEDLLASAGGGAIASIGATTPTYVGPNFSFNLELFEHLFADGATSHVPLGLVQQLSKVEGPLSNGAFNETYMLLGDPAMRLVLPQALVRFTSGADTLATGNRARIEGEVISPADSTRVAGFTGQADVEVRGSDDTSGYRRPPPDNLYIPYDLPGPPLYRGTVAVADGRFAFDFIVPVGARTGDKGRVSAYAYSMSVDARGENERLNVEFAAPSDTSVGAPRIALRFPNDRTRVKAGTPLTAEIRDENGINIQGTSLRNSIYLDFDRRNEPLDVTDQFRYAAGSDSVGSLTVPLPGDLDPGQHSATLIASDNLLNTGTASVEFDVVQSEIVQLVNVLAFPNPFRDWTRFFFEITDPAEVEVQVFTTSGREVWHHRQRFETGTQGSIKWDGVDLREDTVANGTYVYRLRAKPDRAGTPQLEHIGKVVIMR